MDLKTPGYQAALCQVTGRFEGGFPLVTCKLICTSQSGDDQELGIDRVTFEETKLGTWCLIFFEVEDKHNGSTIATINKLIRGESPEMLKAAIMIAGGLDSQEQNYLKNLLEEMDVAQASASLPELGPALAAAKSQPSPTPKPAAGSAQQRVDNDDLDDDIPF